MAMVAFVVLTCMCDYVNISFKGITLSAAEDIFSRCELYRSKPTHRSCNVQPLEQSRWYFGSKHAAVRHMERCSSYNCLRRLPWLVHVCFELIYLFKL